MRISHEFSFFALVHPRPDSANEDELLIGEYSRETEARAAIDRLKDKKGFVGAPSGFESHQCQLNRDNWTDGFVSVNSPHLGIQKNRPKMMPSS